MNSVNDGNISVKNLSNPTFNNQKVQNSVPKQSNFEEVVKDNIRIMSRPMNPSVLYSLFFFSLYFLWNK